MKMGILFFLEQCLRYILTQIFGELFCDVTIEALTKQSPHSDYVTRCYFNLCLQQGSRDDRVSRDVFSFLYVQYVEFCTVR